MIVLAFFANQTLRDEACVGEEVIYLALKCYCAFVALNFTQNLFDFIQVFGDTRAIDTQMGLLALFYCYVTFDLGCFVVAHDPFKFL